jgi:hypothetical protein
MGTARVSENLGEIRKSPSPMKGRKKMKMCEVGENENM